MRVAVFSSGRQDVGILAPIAEALDAHPAFEVEVILGGMHGRQLPVATRLGRLPVREAVDTLPEGDSALAVAQGAGRTTILLADALDRSRADAVLLAGDRTETLGAGLAAACLQLPILHLHGGEETEGAIDNACRHALSKLAQVHFVAHPSFAARLRAMGEDPARIFVTGAPALDRLRTFQPLPAAELAARLGMASLGSPLLALTHHPTTLGGRASGEEAEILLEGLHRFLAEHPAARVVATRPNADEGGQHMHAALRAFAGGHPALTLVDALGEAYFSLLHHADAMLGNSSSGLVEAPSFHLPVVNVGERQAGRLRGANVLDVPLDPSAVADGLARALDPAFRARLASEPNPYGDGRAAERTLDALLPLAPMLRRGAVRKAFHDLRHS